MNVTTPTVWRPEILRRTLESFCANLMWLNPRTSTLLLNIDPAPAGSEDRSAEVIEVASRFFGNVTPMIQPRASFPMAVRSLWETVPDDSPYFLHLEDDWTLEEEVDLGELMGILDRDRTLSAVSLRAYPEMRDDGRVLLSPGVFRVEHARRMAKLMKPGEDPEKSLRPARFVNRQIGVRGRLWPADRAVVKDIGRDWREQRGLRKNLDGGNRLTQWA